MNKNIEYLNIKVFDTLGLKLTQFTEEAESQEYDACQFKLNRKKIVSRTAKITPKKVGQFVTCWKRSLGGPIEPFSELDAIDYFMITVKTDEFSGQFVFPKEILIKKGILSTQKKEGKRGFRVYPPWDNVRNKQAERAQKWQLNYFYNIDNSEALERLHEFYKGWF